MCVDEDLNTFFAVAAASKRSMELRMWIKVLFILQLLQDLLECRVYSYDCSNRNQYAVQDGRCCMKCRAGQMVKQHCVAGAPNSTQCQDCEEGRYQSKPNKDKYCHYCKIRSNRIISRNCTKTHNRKYGGCVKGFYNAEFLDDCKECKICPKGFGVKKECHDNVDTECSTEKCSPGEYSDEKSSTQKCTKCSSCGIGQEMLKTCTAISNYECRERPSSTPSTLPTPSVPSTMLEPASAASSGNRGWVMPFFVSAMVLLIVLFFGFVIGVSLWCHRHSRRGSVVVIEGPVEICQEDTKTVLLPKKEFLDNGMLIRKVSHNTIEELAICLNPENSAGNWKKVASLLGFSWGSIRNLELTPSYATQNMLERWSTKKDSTIFKLHRILKDMKRDDAAEVLEKLLEPTPSYPNSV